MSIDPSPASGLSRVLQGQESSTLRGTVAESNESESSEKPAVWAPSLDDEKMEISASRRYGSERWLPLGRPESSFTDLLSGFGNQMNSSSDYCITSGDPTAVAGSSMKRQLQQDHDGKFNLHGNAWSLMSSGLSLNLMDSSTKTYGQGIDTSYQSRGDARYNGYKEYCMISGSRIDNQQPNWLMPPPMTSYLQLSANSRELMQNHHALAQQHENVKPKEGNCKLFGIPLRSNSVGMEPVLSHKNRMIDSASQSIPGMHSHHSPAFELDKRTEQHKILKLVDNPISSNEQEKPSQSIHQVSRDRESKAYGSSTRSCTKVSKSCYCVWLISVVIWIVF